MLLVFSFLTLLCFLFEPSRQLQLSREQELENKFLARSNADWRDLWHHERHVRCERELLRHMDWACEKDIYKLIKRTANSIQSWSVPDAGIQGNEVPADYSWNSEGDLPFVNLVQARSFLKERRKRSKKSITAECCLSNGCTWEEYAEYCPANKRIRKFL